MGKAADRRRQALKRGEKPNSTTDRVKHQIKLNDANLYNMYIWHETKMNELKDKHNDELLEFVSSQVKKAEKAKDLEISKLKIRHELKMTKLINKYEEPNRENEKITEQAKDLLQTVMVSQLCESKRNSILFSKARAMGLLETKNFRKIKKMLEADDIEDKLLNPVFDLTQEYSSK